MELRIGCTGWSYDAWVGSFYPKNTKKTDFLKFYSGIFDCTEINSSFYRIPNQFMAKKWFVETPDSFRFSVKFPKVITHDNRLSKLEPYLDQFFYGINPLKKKVSALIIQLPPSLSFDEAKPKMDILFDKVPKDYRYAVEGRHESWFTDESVEHLKEKNVCLVWNEIAGVDNPAPITTDFVYLRIIGDRSIPDDQFGKVHYDKTDVLKKWVQRIKNANVKKAFVMTNNHFVGFGPATANDFRAMMGLEKLQFVDRKQRTLFGPPDTGP